MRLSISGMRFRPTLLPTLVAAIFTALTLYLGYWQQGRAAEKELVQAEFDARGKQPAVILTEASLGQDMRYRRVIAAGTWHAMGEIFLDNKVNEGVAGYDVVTPLKLHGGNVYVLVNRGWIARGPAYPEPPVVPRLPESGSVTGILVQPTSRFFELSAESVQGQVWQNLTIARYRAATALDVLPYVLLADRVEPPLKQVVEQPSAGVDKHKEYMLTWYSLAATTTILWIVLNFRPATGRETAANGSDLGNSK